MAIALLSNVASTGSTTSVTSGAINTTGATHLIVMAATYDAVGTPNIADSAGNSWTVDKQLDYATSLTYTTIWRATTNNTSASHTVTVDKGGSALYPAIVFSAWSGTDGGAPDVSNTNTVASPATSLSTGSVIPSQDNSLVLSTIAGFGGISHLATSPMTTLGHKDYAGGASFAISGSYEIQTTATARNPQTTWTNGASVDGISIVYKPAASGAAATYIGEDERLPVPHARPRHITPVEEVAPGKWPWRQGAFVNNGASSSTTVVAAFPATVTGASLICATIAWTDPSGTDTVTLTDDKGNTYLQPAALTQYDATYDTWQIGAYCANPTGNPQTLTATISSSRLAGKIIADEFIGGFTYLDRALSADQVGSEIGTDLVTSGAVTPRANNELVYGFAQGQGGAGSGFIIRPGTNFSPGVRAYVNFVSEYLVQIALAGQAATFSSSQENASPHYLSYVATFSLTPLAIAPLVQEHPQLLARRPRHRLAEQDEFTSRIAVGTPPFLVAEEPRSLPPSRPRHPPADLDQGSWPFTAVATVGRLVAEEPGRLPPRRPAHASPAQDELNAVFASAPTVFKPIGEDDRRLPPGRPWHHTIEAEQAPIDWPHRQSAFITNGASSSTTVVTTLGNPVAPNSLILATISWSGLAGDTVSLQDDKGNIYTLPSALAQFDSGAGTWWVGAYLFNPTGNPTVFTATISTSRQFARLGVDEFKGGWAYLDRAQSAAQGSLSPGTDIITSGSVTPRTANELIYGSAGLIGGPGSYKFVAGTGFSLAYTASGGGNFPSEFQVQSAPTGVAATFSQSVDMTGARALSYVATFSFAPIPLGSLVAEEPARLPPARPWHRLADVDQGGWPFTAVATVGRLIEEHRQRLPPARPYHRTPDVDQGAWPFSVAPLNTATYLPEDEQHRPRQRPWHSMLTEHADLQVPPPAPVSLFYAYGQAGARSVG